MNVIERAVELFHSESFRYGPANPQVYDFEVAHGLTHLSLEKWWWEAAYNEARLERAVEAGNAEMSPYGPIYTATSEEYNRRMLLKSLEDVCPGNPHYSM